MDAGDARAIANKTSEIRFLRGTGSIVGRFFTLLGSPNDTDVGPVCNDAGGNALAWTFGLGNFTNGYGKDESTGKEDLGASKFFLFLGTNQAETHPVTFAYLLRGRAKTRAKLVVIDPRLTPTGAQADKWIAPKPHTDLALVLAMLHQVIEKKLYDEAFVKKWVLGFDELKAHLAKLGYTPEWAEKITGVPAGKIRGIAEGYAKGENPRPFFVTRASRISSMPLTPTARCHFWRPSPGTWASTAAVAISCTILGRAG